MLIETVSMLPLFLAVTLHGVAAYIVSTCEFRLVATVNTMATNDILWAIETPCQWSENDLWLLGAVRSCSCTESSIRNLLYLVAQVMRTRALGTFYNAAKQLMHMRSGTISADLFKSTVFLRAWPKINVERSWSVEIAIKVGIGYCTSINATAITLPPLALPVSSFCHRSPGFQKFEYGINLSISILDNITPLGVLDMATTLASSRAVSRVLTEVCYSGIHHEHIAITRRGDVTGVISSPFGTALAVTCFPFYGAFSMEGIPLSEAIPRHVFDRMEDILTQFACHDQLLVDDVNIAFKLASTLAAIKYRHVEPA
jgi:hypothetical protein